MTKRTVIDPDKINRVMPPPKLIPKLKEKTKETKENEKPKEK